MGLSVNPLLRTDSYKLSHVFQYPDNTEYVYANFTARKSRVPGVNYTVHFALQAYLTDLQEGFERFFAADKDTVLDEYRRKTATFVNPGFTVDHVAALHDLGYLPIRVSGAPEGSLIPIRVPSVTIENTHPDFFWLTNYIETDLSASIWHPSTSATTAWHFRTLLDDWAEKTAESNAYVDFQAHDFSYRGQVNYLAAAASSAGHCLSFRGSDTLPVIDYVETYYPGEDNGLIAASVPATEHSVMCAGGKDDEKQTYDRLLGIYPEGILSIVSDTWDFFKVLTQILPQLKDKIMARNGKLVIRPDSGDPADIICGLMTNKDYVLDQAFGRHDFVKADEAKEKGAIELLWEVFGGTVNEKGLKVLDSHIGLIYGDSIYYDRANDILRRLESKGFSAENVVFGVGSYTYQMVTRDTYGSAVKATQVRVGGEERDIFKDPATDDGTKKSATGLLAVFHHWNGVPYLVEHATREQVARSLLQPVWEDGKFLKTYSYAEVRENLARTTAIAHRNGSI